jgi:hypothetical protein
VAPAQPQPDGLAARGAHGLGRQAQHADGTGLARREPVQAVEIGAVVAESAPDRVAEPIGGPDHVIAAVGQHGVASGERVDQVGTLGALEERVVAAAPVEEVPVSGARARAQRVGRLAAGDVPDAAEDLVALAGLAVVGAVEVKRGGHGPAALGVVDAGHTAPADDGVRAIDERAHVEHRHVRPGAAAQGVVAGAADELLGFRGGGDVGDVVVEARAAELLDVAADVVVVESDPPVVGVVVVADGDGAVGVGVADAVEAAVTDVVHTTEGGPAAGDEGVIV